MSSEAEGRATLRATSSRGTVWIFVRGAGGGVSFQQYVRERTDGSRHLFYIGVAWTHPTRT